MRRFIGLTILTGIVRKPRLDMHWESDIMTAIPFFGQTMTRNRYRRINRFFHFANNEDEAVLSNGDKLWKVRPIIEHLKEKFMSNYQLHQNISIDEGTLKWKGRLRFKVYNPMKPIKYGIKSYILADSESSYCYEVNTYEGTTKPFSQTVMDLVAPHLDKNHKLYMDNLYNSVKLAEDLLKRKVYVTGTLRRNRGEPESVNKAGTPGHILAKGQSIDRDNGQVLVSAWQDNRTVRFLSTQHDNSREAVDVRQRGGHILRVSKPTALVDYNRYMGGVDGIDQMISYYPVTRKTLKWPKKICWYWVELALHNACIIYNHGKPARERLPLLQFQKKVVLGLCHPEVDDNLPEVNNDETEDDDDELLELEEQVVQQQPQLPPAKGRERYLQVQDTPNRLEGGFLEHKMVSIPSTERDARPQRRCRVCARRDKKRRDTRYWCQACRVALCKGDCFEVYHSRQNYMRN